MLTEKPRLPVREILLIGFLPSPLKKLIYRLKGYRFGKSVSIGIGAVICARQVVIGDNSQIGFFSIIRGERIRIGSHVKIGATTFIDTPYLEIGDETKINEQVFIGGLQFPNASIKIGRNCQIMQMSFINPTRSITIGDDTGIGGHSLIFGHTSWLSQFEGYPVEFADIEIGNSVSIAWRVFVLPGTKIGDGAVVGANSLVHRIIPPRCLAVGFPARVVSKTPEFPKPMTYDDKKRLLRHVVNEFIHFLQDSHIITRTIEDGLYEIKQSRRMALFLRRKNTWQMRVFYDPIEAMPTARCKHPSVFLCLGPIKDEVRKDIEAIGYMWIDIENKTRSDYGNPLGEEVVQYLKRYGVRLVRYKALIAN